MIVEMRKPARRIAIRLAQRSQQFLRQFMAPVLAENSLDRSPDRQYLPCDGQSSPGCYRFPDKTSDSGPRCRSNTRHRPMLVAKIGCRTWFMLAVRTTRFV